MVNKNDILTISQEYFNEYNLKFADDKNKSFNNKRNFIIGPNGGGKTRLLKAVKKFYEDKGSKVVFADFPALVGKGSYKLPKEDIIESIFNIIVHNTDIELTDFLLLIEADALGFIEKLSEYSRCPVNEKKKVQIAIEKINEFMGKFLNVVWSIPLKEIVNKKNDIYMKKMLLQIITNECPLESVICYT